LAEIAPPFTGRIVKSFIKLGQKVAAGSPLFELGSAEFYEAVKSYFAAQSANEVAQKNCNRQKELAAHGVASQKDLEQAQSEANIAQQEFEQAKASLQIFNIDIASVQTGQPLKIISPISGEIVKCNITIGSYAKEDSEPLAVVADLSKVWVAALVKEKYFGAIKQGDRVEVYTDAHPNKIIWGTIYHIGEMLDEETRSLEVIVECNNADRELKLGMFCETHFLSAPTKAVILPATAIMQEQDSDYVFVEISKGKFVRRKVSTESLHGNEVRIISGISEGENVIIEGGIYLQ
jgi:cobalt-zinc-cadmium efflux system membrane fusion protein